MLLHNGNIQLVDVRTGLEYSESHIPGAINMNVMDDSFTVHVDSVLQKDIPVVGSAVRRLHLFWQRKALKSLIWTTVLSVGKRQARKLISS